MKTPYRKFITAKLHNHTLGIPICRFTIKFKITPFVPPLTNILQEKIPDKQIFYTQVLFKNYTSFSSLKFIIYTKHHKNKNIKQTLLTKAEITFMSVIEM